MSPTCFRACALSSLALVAAFASASPIKRAQQPSLSPDGTRFAFSWQGDIWVVPSAGGIATRITVHPANDAAPRWSPDGSRIAFTSNRYGSLDAFSMAADGSDLQRVTFESGTEYAYNWSNDGRFLLGYTTTWGRANLFKVPSSGGDMIRLTNHPLETQFYPAEDSVGKIVYCAGGGAGNWRKPGLRGSSASDIWVGAGSIPVSSSTNLTKDDFSDLFPMPASDGTIYFVSNRSGWPNIWRMGANGSGARQLTSHMDGTVRWPSLSRNGSKIVYEFESEIWILDTASGAHHAVTIDVPDDARINPTVSMTMTTGVQDYAVSPDGKRTVIAVRGDLYLLPERGGTTKRLTDHPGWDGNPRWLDSKTILFVSGRNVKREFFTVNIDGVTKPFLSRSLDVASPIVSPDAKWIAFHHGHKEIAIVPAGGGELKVIAKGNFTDGLNSDNRMNWSPDSKWLAIDELTDRGSNIVLRNIETGKAVTVAMTARGISAEPRFLPNGRGIFFNGDESGDGPDLFVVDLVPQDVTFTESDLEGIDEPRKATPEVKVEIYEPGLMDRMRRLTSTGQAGDAICSPDSRTLYFSSEGQFSSISVAGGAATPLSAITGGVGAPSFGVGGTKMYFVSQGRLTAWTVGSPAASPVPFSARATVDLKAEEKAIFDEIWWAMDRFYYNETMNDKGWPKIKAKFAQIVPHAFDRTDFYALMGEMMEELDSSHLGATAPASDPGINETTGFLGVDWDWKTLADSGQFVVAEVLDGGPANHPMMKLEKGDRLVSVNGEKPGPGKPLAKLLTDTTGRKVMLGIQRGGKDLQIAFRPGSLGSRSGLNYDNYVKWCRTEVERLSGGKLTYLHIEGMNAPSLELFLRQIRTLTQGKKGVVIDVRFNGGGSTAHQILGVLIKTPWLIRTRRGYDMKVSENIFRGDSLEMPSALLINGASFSNAEIFAEGFRKLKVGPIIGVPTAGGVIGTGGFGLWDGGFIRMPSFGAYAVDGENLELNGRKPDIHVPFDLNAWQSGRDLQLERAVAELMKRIK